MVTGVSAGPSLLAFLWASAATVASPKPPACTEPRLPPLAEVAVPLPNPVLARCHQFLCHRQYVAISGPLGRVFKPCAFTIKCALGFPFQEPCRIAESTGQHLSTGLPLPAWRSAAHRADLHVLFGLLRLIQLRVSTLAASKTGLSSGALVSSVRSWAATPGSNEDVGLHGIQFHFDRRAWARGSSSSNLWWRRRRRDQDFGNQHPATSTFIKLSAVFICRGRSEAWEKRITTKAA
jgi:hypothetical protein